jgi:hypothetical protein
VYTFLIKSSVVNEPIAVGSVFLTYPLKVASAREILEITRLDPQGQVSLLATFIWRWALDPAGVEASKAGVGEDGYDVGYQSPSIPPQPPTASLSRLYEGRAFFQKYSVGWQLIDWQLIDILWSRM